LGRVARCVDPAAEAGTIDLYALPFEDVDGTIYTSYFLATPGGELAWADWVLEDGGTAFGNGRIASVEHDLSAAWGVFEGEPTSFEMYGDEFELIFEAEL